VPEPDSAGLAPRRVAVVADTDTRWKWGVAVARHVTASDELVSGFIVESPNLPSERQLADLGPFRGPLRVVPTDELRHPSWAMSFDVVVLALTGGGIFRAVDALHRCFAASPLDRRPVVVTGYVGVVYEKYLDGMLLRVGADVVCLNSQHDLELFRASADLLGVADDAFVRCGYAIIDRTQRVDVHAPPRTLTFVVQPSVPASAAQRIYALERLLEYARKHTDRTVLVKLRARADERTTHEERFHYEDLLRELRVVQPPNLQFVYGRMDKVLDRTDLCVTVSSTAALESLARGIPTAVLRDFGVKELLGNHFFAGSGCLASFDEIIRDELPVVDETWRERNGLGEQDDMRALATRVAELQDRQRTLGEMLPWPAQYYTPATAPAAYEELTESWGTDEPSRNRVVARARATIRRTLRGPLYRYYRRVARWAGI
jgi:hypothetical protein